MAKESRTVTVNGTTYDADTLSQKALDQAENLRVADREIARVEQQLAIYQTARAAYAQALARELPDDKR